MIQEICVLDDGGYELVINVRHMFMADRNEVKVVRKTTDEIHQVLRNIPSILIINEDKLSYDAGMIIDDIKSDDDNAVTPVVVISSNTSRKHRVDIMKKQANVYIRKPFEEEYLYYTVKNLLNLLKINRRVSPLTGLPGNVQIQTELKRRILNRETFAILYLDLDNFKAFNDVYGFSEGDEIIKYTAKVIAKNTVQNPILYDTFLGHIGGDDYIAVIGETDYERICEEIIEDFDKNILSFFNEKDRNNGYIEVKNRKGEMEKFPLTSISIGVVEVTPKKFNNVLEISEAGAEVKKKAKMIKGSSYFIDRRK